MSAIDSDVLKWCTGLRIRLVAIPADQRFSFAQAEIAKLTEPPQTMCAQLILLGYEIDRDQRQDRKFLIVAAAVLFVYIAAIPFLVPNPTVSQMFIFRLISTLLAGVAGAFIPGSLGFAGKTSGFAIKGTSAFALALIVYLINPPALLPTEWEIIPPRSS